MLSLLSPRILIALALSIALGAACLWLRHSGVVAGRAEVTAAWSKEKLQQADAQREIETMRRKAANSAAQGHEADKVVIQTKFVPITSEVEHVITQTVYSNICLPDDGLQLLRAAVAATGDGDTAIPVKPMPATSASR